MTARVLHVTPALSWGGAGRSALFAAGALAERLGGEHRILSLRPAAPGTRGAASECGVALLDAPRAKAIDKALAEADVVHLHFWSTPELHELLARGLPSTRLLVWSHVAGAHAPQVLARAVCDRAHLLVVNCSRTARLPAVRASQPRAPIIPASSGWLPGPRRARSPHGTFVVGYLGTVGWAKLHPQFVPMSTAARLPRTRFVVCGGGDALAHIRGRVHALGVSGRWEFLGALHDVAPVLRRLDVFGYPLAEGSYATCDLALQEAMLHGVAPIVMAHDTNAAGVEHGRTGLVAETTADYTRALERLHADPAERVRLGHAAREHARCVWGPHAIAASWEAVYRELLDRPPAAVAPIPLPEAGEHPGAERFVHALADDAEPFARSLALGEDAGVGACSPATATADGGLLDFRRRHPADGLLALWTGLHFAVRDRRALAAGQLADARRLGVASRRIEAALEQTETTVAAA